MTTDDRLRVLIAENHEDLADVMSRIIDAEPDMRCVGQVAEANEVVAAARDAQAQALILDLMLQGGSGLALIEELKRELPALRIIVFSGLASTDELVREAKRRGAAACVTKGCEPTILLNELRKQS